MGFHERLVLFEHDRLEHRFWSPRWREERVEVPFARIAAQIDALDLEHTQRVTLAGGRPTDHPHFGAALLALKNKGIARIGVESEASALDEASIAAMVADGVRDLFLHVGGVRKKVHEQVMRDPGGHEPAMRALVAAARSGAAVYVVVPLMRGTLEDLEPLVEWMLVADAKPRGLLLALPRLDELPENARKLTVPFERVAESAAKVFRRCHDVRMEYGFDGPESIAPCASRVLDRFGTVFHERLAHYKRRPELALEKIAACDECSLRNVCRGVEPAYVRTHGAQSFQPVPLEVSMDWKLRPLNRLEAREFKNVSDFDNEVEENSRSLLRINGHCNMSCAFCFVDRTAPDFPAEEMEREIDRMRRGNEFHLVLSGGEPTLHPDLSRLVAYARDRGFRTVEMQSNGVKLAELEYARALVEAGLNKVTISLHSVDPAHSDRITRLPQAFGKTIDGIHNLRRLGVETQIAHVLTKANYRDLPGFVRHLAQEFPRDGGHLSICLAIAQGISDLVYDWVIPSFRDIEPFVREALDFCLENDIGFGGMLGQGGFPPCMLGGEMKYYERVLGHIYRSADHDKQFHKAERCRECSFDPWCVGVRKAYVQTYGDDEIRPFRAEIHAPPPKHERANDLVTLRRGP